MFEKENGARSVASRFAAAASWLLVSHIKLDAGDAGGDEATLQRIASAPIV